LTYARPHLLANDHSLDGFDCASPEQTEWLRRHARQSMAAGSTRVLVVTPFRSPDVVAYYAWAMAHLDVADAPERLRRGAGRYPQPVALLARLGVDRHHEGRGLGTGLVGDVVTRAAELSSEIGCRGLLVHCESAEARAFYLRVLPDFEESPTDPMHLVLLMKDIRRTLGHRPA
jgi:GNAT superfamily N-acetyltransferase